MSAVGVVHMDLESKGGGEAVAMAVLERLQESHDVTLVTLTDPDVPELNDYFNTDVDPAALEIRRAGRFAPALHERYGVRFYVLQNALLGRYASRHADEFDLLVSTINELGLPPDAVQYVHFPFDWTVSCSSRDDIFHPSIEEDSLYERLCSRLSGVTRESIDATTVFANSEWTAESFAEAYGTAPAVLPPPIDTSEFDDRPWDDRENGFVTVGRVERSKRIVEQIAIVDGLRERGHDVHFHVVGPTYDETYAREVAAVADERPYVEIEGELPRSELVRRICTHRYGIHGKRFEHFGMAVAELAAGGAIPFLPSDGGQRSIVEGDERLLYDSVDEAVEKADRVLSRSALQRRLRRSPAEIERRFGRERFQERFSTAVREAIDREAPSPSTPDETPSTVAPTDD